MLKFKLLLAQNKLKAIGLTPINNIVDITNFVLHGLGQPLHAFDADSVAKTYHSNSAKKWKIYNAWRCRTHAQRRRSMVCDAKNQCVLLAFLWLTLVLVSKPLIFSWNLRTLILCYRKTAKRHGLSTDASFRFERGVDQITKYALKHAAILLQKLLVAKFQVIFGMNIL